MIKIASVLQHRLFAMGLVLILELAAIVLAFQLLVSFECDATESPALCLFLRSMVARAITVFAAMALIGWARPKSLGFLLARADAPSRGRGWLVLHALGIALIFAPLLVLLSQGAHAVSFSVLLVPWALGASCASLGALFWLAPPAEWQGWLARESFLPLAIFVFAFMVPELAGFIQTAWQIEHLTRATFTAIGWVLQVIGTTAEISPADYVIGIGDFHVRIANACSGVEGFALVLVFTLLYGFLFRRETRFPHIWILLPVGLAVSWIFNVIRISALIWIGAHVSPELAANGFHSYAGWLFFTILSLGILAAARTVPWFQARPGARNAPPLREDWMAAFILPFVFFMLASVVVSAFFTVPDIGYGLKFAAMALALAYFTPIYRRLVWTPDPLALAAGAGIGLMWLALLPAGDEQGAALAQALAGLAPAAFALWALLRVLGTTLLVPMVEELFFRGYILARLDTGTPRSRWVGLALSSGLFAALHGRWFAAGIAGAVFGLVMLRRGRVTDAVQAHVTANLVVALWALARGEWSAI